MDLVKVFKLLFLFDLDDLIIVLVGYICVVFYLDEYKWVCLNNIILIFKMSDKMIWIWWFVLKMICLCLVEFVFCRSFFFSILYLKEKLKKNKSY